MLLKKQKLAKKPIVQLEKLNLKLQSPKMTRLPPKLKQKAKTDG